MSSLRNAVHRRSHRERAAPLERQKLGLLEKHKDYSLRAKDHKKKQAILKNLRAKVADKNEDEFYYGMLSRGKFDSGKLSSSKRWSGKVHGDRGNTALDVDVVRLLKTQDIGYLRTVRNVAAKEVAVLEQRAIMAGAFGGQDVEDELGDDSDDFDDDDDDAPAKTKPKPRAKKIVFADSVEEIEQKVPKEDEDEEMEDDFEGAADEKVDIEAAKRAHHAARLRQKLQNARKKLKALTDAENELEMQRARMAKTATVGGVTKKGKVFKIRERKR